MAHVLLLDMAIHTFDAARYISGADPVSVYAEEFNPTWSWYRHGASANAMFEMTGGSALLIVAPVRRGFLVVLGRGLARRRRAGYGGLGWERDAARRSRDRGGGFSLSVRAGRGNAGYGAVGDCRLARRVPGRPKTGSTPWGECHHNIKSLAMVFGAIASAERGERVEVAEILAG